MTDNLNPVFKGIIEQQLFHKMPENKNVTVKELSTIEIADHLKVLTNNPMLDDEGRKWIKIFNDELSLREETQV